MAATASVLLALAPGALGGCGDDDILFPPGTGGSIAEQIVPAPGGVRRLLARQYVSSVGMLFGEQAAAAAAPPADSSLHGFASIGNARVALDAASVEQYEASANAVAMAVIADADSLAAVMPCAPSGATDSACFRQFVEQTGRVAWRRDLEQSEIERIGVIAVDAASRYGAWQYGVHYAILALLTAPDFLYVVELGEPDSSGRHWLTPTELSVRLSLFLTDTIPTAAMLDAAAAGALDSDDGVRALATELLQRPEAKHVTRAFFDELYHLRNLRNLTKDEASFPDYSSEVGLAMRESMHLLLSDIIWDRDADMRELMIADFAYVNETLAPIYGVNVAGSNMVRLPLPADQDRIGMLGQAAFLTVESKTTRESAVKRGVFIRQNLMCDSIPPPPPNVTPELPEPDPEEPQTQKQMLEKHQEEPSCAACHLMVDPPAYPLQIFDGIGKHRSDEHGLPIDPSGSSPGLGDFADIYDLTALLYDNQQVPSCLVRNFYRHSIGHLEEKEEEPAIAAIAHAFEDAGFSVQSMLVELALSPAFRMVGQPK